jgi:hypothetical protein
VSRNRYRSGSRGYYRSGSYGRERALEHIADAKRLTGELGGMDQEVKAYFFSLPPPELSAVLDEYEQAYGSSARQYAAYAIPKWRAGRVQMGGVVAERLFNLLPTRMPLAVKYKLVEGLWRHVGPSSTYRLPVGPDVDVAQVVEFARSKITEFAVEYKIPADLERRFDWLAAGDVTVKQMLLSHIQEIEKAVAVEAVRAQLPVMLEHLRSAGSHTGRLAQIIHVGKHELEIVLDKAKTEIVTDWQFRTILSGSTDNNKMLTWIIIILTFFILCFGLIIYL